MSTSNSEAKLKGEKGMDKSIMQKVKDFQADLKAGRRKPKDNALLATAAIHAGVHSAAWERYMEQFAAGNTQHLMRLMATDGTLGDFEMDRRRAYLVGGAVCGTTTTDDFGKFVDGIDDGL